LPVLKECKSCKQKKPVYASIRLQVGDKVQEASACEKCFKATIEGNVAAKMIIGQFLPPEWKGLIDG
jgi:hypothetical protein